MRAKRFRLILEIEAPPDNHFPGLRFLHMHSRADAYLLVGERKKALHYYEEAYKVAC